MMAKSPKASIDKLSDAPFRVTTPREDVPEPAQARPIFGGPAHGYRDGAGVVETKLFHDGARPDGWHDTPAKCKNNYRDGMVKVP